MVAGPRTQDFPQQQTLIVNPARLHLTVEIEGTTTRAGTTQLQLEFTQHNDSSSSESSSGSNKSSDTSSDTDDSVKDTSRQQVVSVPQEDSDDDESESSDESEADIRPTKKQHKRKPSKGKHGRRRRSIPTVTLKHQRTNKRGR